jgi:uncharacterized protein involved in exopolysaccharide biosynthesis
VPRLTGLAGISAQLGLGNLIQGTEFGSADFYKELLETRAILGEVADTPFDIPREDGQFHGTLADYWKIRASTPERRRDRAIRRLRDVLSITVDHRIQLVAVAVKTRSAHLSEAIAERALQLVNRFNQERLQSQSAQERRFIGSRLEEAKGELRDAEDAVARFMQQNRDFRNSPVLFFQYERLQREVALRQGVYTTLAQNYEQSRIEEVRDTPVITVIQKPELPPQPNSRLLALKLALALVGGTLLGVVGAFSKEFVVRGAHGVSPDFSEFENLLAEVRQELRRPWRLLRVHRS